MSDELIELLTVLAIGLSLGLLIGVALRKAKPAWCRSYAKFCRSRKWWLFAVGILLFLGLTIGSFARGRHLFGVLFATFLCLEAFAFVSFGFQRLTPEEEAQMDAWDPRKLWPLWPWKRPRRVGVRGVTDGDRLRG